MMVTTGAEAVENAVKMARAYTGRSGVIAFSGAFHGRTLMGMALCGKVVPYKKASVRCRRKYTTPRSPTRSTV